MQFKLVVFSKLTNRINSFLKNRNLTLWILILILLAAHILRIYGLGFGLPYITHPDEQNVSTRALEILQLKHLDPYQVHKPPLYIYLQTLVYLIFFSIGALMGLYHSTEELALATVNDGVPLPSPELFLVGRYTSALVGTLTVLLVYLCGKRLFGRKVGLISSLFSAFSYLHVEQSHFLKDDIHWVFFTMWSFLYLFTFLKNMNFRSYKIGLTLWVISFITKYNALPLVIPFLYALIIYYRSLRVTPDSSKNTLDRSHLSSTSRRHLRAKTNLALRPLKSFLKGIKTVESLIFRSSDRVLGGILLGISVLIPFVIVGLLATTTKFFDSGPTGVFWEFNHYFRVGHPGFEGDNNWLYFLTYLYEQGMGKAFLIFSIGGIIYSLYRLTKGDLMILSFTLSYFILFSLPKVNFVRNLLPLPLLLSILSARFLVDISSRLGERLKIARGRENLIVSLLSALLIVSPIISVVRADSYISGKDTRLLAAEWIIQEIPKGTKLVVEGNNTFIPKEFYQIKRVRNMGDESLGDYKAGGWKYLISNEESYGRVESKDGNDAIYKQQSSQVILLKDFPGNPYNKYNSSPSSPAIRIYKLN